MSGTPLTLRVRFAFGDYPAGYIFHSPPLPGTLRQDWLERGLIELVEDTPKTEEPKPKHVVRGKK